MRTDYIVPFGNALEEHFRMAANNDIFGLRILERRMLADQEDVLINVSLTSNDLSSSMGLLGNVFPKTYKVKYSALYKCAVIFILFWFGFLFFVYKLLCIFRFYL